MWTGKPDPGSLFDSASRVFDGWDDSETGLRVLRLVSPGTVDAAEQGVRPLRTLYHQHMYLLNRGENVLLRNLRGQGAKET